VIGAGVLDIWRNPKLQYEMLKQVNAPLYISARIEPANIYAGREVSIKSSIVSELEQPQTGFVSFAMATQSKNNQKTLWTKTIPVEAARGVTLVIDEKITIPADATGECILDVVFDDANGQRELANNRFTCDIFTPLSPSEIQPPRPLVIIGKSKLNNWLDKHGVAYREKLPAGNDHNITIITATENPTPEELQQFRDIFKKVEQGATLVMLNPPLKFTNYRLADPPKEETLTTKNRFYTSGVFPLNLVERPAKGHWVSNNHAIAPNHPYFAGLPTKCFMGQLYANIAPMKTIMGLREKPIVSSVSWTIDRSYKGVKEAWWGSDLTRVPHGKGAIILSTLALVPNLDTDPVADIVMKNIINGTR